MKLGKTKLDYILQGMSFACLLATSLYLLINWDHINSSIPAHYGSGGHIDRMGDKSELLVLFGIAWLLFIGFYLISKFPNLWNIPKEVNESNQEKVYLLVRHLLNWEMLIVTVNLCFLSLYPLTNQNLPVFFTPVFIGLTLTLIIIYLIKIFKID